MINFLLKLNRTLTTSLLFCVVMTGQAKGDVLDDVKSVYIYNFLSFVQWPSSPSLDTGDYQICISASESITDKLKAVVSGEKVDGRSINIKTLNSTASCHLLYMDKDTQVDQSRILELKQSGTLLVSDAPGFVESGGMVGFESRGRKVRVAMNLTELEKVGFKVSSKLLRVVRIER